MEFAIKYNWRNALDNSAPKEEHVLELQDSALSRITEMSQDGFNCGELTASIEDVDYRGWWEHRIVESD